VGVGNGARSQRVVVIGAGIVGNSLAYHLTRLGVTDITLLDKGPLPNPGGSTGHASNFIFPVDHSKEMTSLTLESLRQYQDLDVFIESGGIEIARTQDRMPTRACSRSTATESRGARRNGIPAGGRRSSTRNIWPCATGWR